MPFNLRLHFSLRSFVWRRFYAAKSGSKTEKFWAFALKAVSRKLNLRRGVRDWIGDRYWDAPSGSRREAFWGAILDRVAS